MSPEARERETPAALHEQHHEAADDRHILRELRLLHLPYGVLIFPKSVGDQRGDNHESDHQRRRVTRLDTENDRQPAEELHRRPDQRHDRGEGYALLLETRRKGGKPHQLAVPAQDEDAAEKDAAEQQKLVTEPFRKSIDAGHGRRGPRKSLMGGGGANGHADFFPYDTDVTTPSLSSGENVAT